MGRSIQFFIVIDCHCKFFNWFRIADWLLSRRHCNKDWQKNVLVIREKIKTAILDMPESEEIVNLLQGSCTFLLIY